jgi:hypothetical protein
MHLYLIIILIFLIINFFISLKFKNYTYDKFFLYVVFYFFLINIINIIYLKDINLFTFGALFSVLILFLYSGLYRSVSIKIMIYLFLKQKRISINKLYKNEFKKKSFQKRVNILINNNFLVKKKKYFILSNKGKKYLKFFKIAQSLYKIKSSG